jgi:hypothetical protein
MAPMLARTRRVSRKDAPGDEVSQISTINRYKQNQ